MSAATATSRRQGRQRRQVKPVPLFVFVDFQNPIETFPIDWITCPCHFPAHNSPPPPPLPPYHPSTFLFLNQRAVKDWTRTGKTVNCNYSQRRLQLNWNYKLSFGFVTTFFSLSLSLSVSFFLYFALQLSSPSRSCTRKETTPRGLPVLYRRYTSKEREWVWKLQQHWNICI